MRKESLSHAAAASSDDSGKATADPSSLGAPAKAPKRSRDERDDNAEDEVELDAINEGPADDSDEEESDDSADDEVELDAIDQGPVGGASTDVDDSDDDAEAPLKKIKI